MKVIIGIRGGGNIDSGDDKTWKFSGSEGPFYSALKGEK